MTTELDELDEIELGASERPTRGSKAIRKQMAMARERGWSGRPKWMRQLQTAKATAAKKKAKVTT